MKSYKSYRCYTNKNMRKNKFGENRMCKKYTTDMPPIQKLLDECANVKVKIDSILFESKNGIIYRGVDLKNINVEYAIKVENIYDINDQNLEAKLNTMLGEKNIGPHIYDTFYINVDDDIVQIVIMELMDEDCAHFLSSSEYSSDAKKYVVKEMIKLVRKQIFEVGVFCADIKPANFMVNGDIDEVSGALNIEKVRMIDFGGGWCSYFVFENVYNLNYSRNVVFYVTMLIQLYYLSRRELIKYDSATKKDILSPFMKALKYNKQSKSLFDNFCNDDKLYNDIARVIGLDSNVGKINVKHIFSYYIGSDVGSLRKDLCRV